MSIIPVISASKMLAVLLKAGFTIERQKGSHIFLKNSMTQKRTIVAMHAGDLSRKMIKIILKEAGLSVKDFLNILRN